MLAALALTIDTRIAIAEPTTSPPVRVANVSAPAGIGWSWDWDDDDDDWEQTATWECPAGCSITWEDDY